MPGRRGKSQASMSRRARRSLQNLGRGPGRRGRRRGERFHVNGTCTWVSRSQESGETRPIALMRELRKGIRLKFSTPGLDQTTKKIR
ncbi:hypothetical protein YC2023_082738 [Brassica napus]